MNNAHPRDTLVLFEQRGRELHAEAAAARLRTPSALRRRLAGSLRRAADRLDPGSRSWTPNRSLTGGTR